MRLDPAVSDICMVTVCDNYHRVYWSSGGSSEVWVCSIGGIDSKYQSDLRYYCSASGRVVKLTSVSFPAVAAIFLMAALSGLFASALSLW